MSSEIIGQENFLRLQATPSLQQDHLMGNVVDQAQLLQALRCFSMLVSFP
jgi:hypothetical protein